MHKLNVFLPSKLFLTLSMFSDIEIYLAHNYLYPCSVIRHNMTVDNVLQYQAEKRHEISMLYHNDPDLLYKQVCGPGLKL